MKPISEALQLVRQHATCKPPTRVAVTDALGLVLAGDIASDIDSPPFSKSLVDGYAVVAADALVGAELIVQEEVAAGAMPSKTVVPGVATRIMTGAPIPAGADAVVMLEHTEVLPPGPDSADRIRLSHDAPQPGGNILPRGTSLRRDETVIRQGTRIRAIEIGMLSEVGRTRVDVIPCARVGILATGDELVPPECVPASGQIRNSNGPMLEALVRQAGAAPTNLGIARDDREHLRGLVQRGFEHDVLLLSGGVSAGKYDLVPEVLSESGVRPVFHKVRLKPGKPLWFGIKPHGGRDTLVFGLPGNPVSSFVCFELFVRPALRQIAGEVSHSPSVRHATLTESFRHRGDRPTYHPAFLHHDAGSSTAQPLVWHGSADLCTLIGANGLVFFPSGDRDYEVGTRVEVIEL